MKNNFALIITSIAKPDNKALQLYAKECKDRNIQFIVIGDEASPKDFHIDGCDFFSLEIQKKLSFALAKQLPEKQYARKNIGYLQAIKNGAEIIIETDDDNFPKETFWNKRQAHCTVPTIVKNDWVNSYKYFSDEIIWPRGFPLEQIQKIAPDISDCKTQQVYCPIQQNLVDQNPDVDAVFRLTQKLPHSFTHKNKIAIGEQTWCPFNSQNTTFFKDAFPLLYLPSWCSFRMTDIWRSFVAQRICWENDWCVLFDEATMWQERNAHNLLKDFEDEIPGYLNNAKICKTLAEINLKKGKEFIYENLITCYKSLIEIEVIAKKEMPLLELWMEDLQTIS